MQLGWQSVVLVVAIAAVRSASSGHLVPKVATNSTTVERRFFHQPSKYNAANSVDSTHFNHQSTKKKRRPWKPQPPFVTATGLLKADSEGCGIRSPQLLSVRGRQARIIGGAEVSYGAAPWQVDIRLFRGDQFEHICGGAIISNHLVVTAAHCVQVNKRYVFSCIHLESMPVSRYPNYIFSPS